MAPTLSITLIILLTMYKNTFPLVTGTYNLKLVNSLFPLTSYKLSNFEPLNVGQNTYSLVMES